MPKLRTLRSSGGSGAAPRLAFALLVASTSLACERGGSDTTSQTPPLDRPESSTAAAALEAPSAEPAAAAPAEAPAQPHPAPALEDERPPRDAPRVYGKSRNVWIRSGPGSDNQWLGFLWLGGSVKIRGDERLAGPGCSQPWVPVEPRGWMCVDGVTATTDPEDPVLLELYRYRPRVETPWPHQYAAVHSEVRRYEALPDTELQSLRERGFERHMELVHRARASKEIPPELAPLDPSLVGRHAPELPPLPRSLSEGRTRIVARSAMAYTAAFDHGERAFLLTADLNWVPRDRVEILPRVEFQGLELKGEVELPLAFFRGRDRPAFRKSESGEFEETKELFPRLSSVPLSGEVEVRDKVRYHRVKDRDVWVSSKEAVIPTPQPKTPWGAPVGGADETGLAPGGRATWVEASVLGGWLIAFEGTRPVYVTLISPGRGGTPHPNKDPLETASTPTGRFPISGKFRTATMESSSSPIVHTDVPWAQNFSGPHAIHTAYWHDDWGNLKSAGCVNVSPRDGKWLFEFTEPEVPEGWHGVRHVGRYGPATLFIVHD